MKNFKAWAGVLFIIVMSGALPAFAQEDTPSDQLVLSSPQGTISMAVPDGWQYIVTPEDVGLYSAMTNRGDTPAGQVPTDVQVIFRDVEELTGVIDAPVDTSAENPALDYLQKYADWSGNRLRGVYGTPASVPSDEFPGALLLYLEEPQAQRFGEGVDVLLSLALAFYMGEDQMLIVLMDGPAGNNTDLIQQWADILETARLNDNPLSFASDLRAILREGMSPDELMSTYEDIIAAREHIPGTGSTGNVDRPLLPGVNLNITDNTNTVIFSLPDEWESEMLGEEDAPYGYIMTHPENLARLSIRLDSIQPISYASPQEALARFLAEDDTLEAAGDTAEFFWNGMPAAFADFALPDPFEDDDEAAHWAGSIVLLELPDQAGLLTLRYEVSPQAGDMERLIWQNTLTGIILNNQRLDFNDILQVLVEREN